VTPGETEPRKEATPVSSQIVVGIDGSQDSLNAYRWAVDESRRRDAELTALFAWELPMIGIPGAFDREELEVQAGRFLNDQLDGLDTDGVTVNRIVAQGDASSSLIEACKRLDAEMLVLGSRGRGGFAGLLLGSVGQECASHAPCPVLICKANGDRPG
jgi:nucleotide-binding universal stress UspA family protein